MKKKSKLKQDYLRLLKKTSSEDLLKIQREIIDALRKYEDFELEIKKILLEGRRFIVKMQKELKGEFSKIDKNYPDPKYESLFGRDVTPRWEIENQQLKRIALKNEQCFDYGNLDWIYKKHNLDMNGIIKQIREFLKH